MVSRYEQALAEGAIDVTGFPTLQSPTQGFRLVARLRPDVVGPERERIIREARERGLFRSEKWEVPPTLVSNVGEFSPEQSRLEALESQKLSTATIQSLARQGELTREQAASLAQRQVDIDKPLPTKPGEYTTKSGGVTVAYTLGKEGNVKIRESVTRRLNPEKELKFNGDEISYIELTPEQVGMVTAQDYYFTPYSMDYLFGVPVGETKVTTPFFSLIPEEQKPEPFKYIIGEKNPFVTFQETYKETKPFLESFGAPEFLSIPTSGAVAGLESTFGNLGKFAGAGVESIIGKQSFSFQGPRISSVPGGQFLVEQGVIGVSYKTYPATITLTEKTAGALADVFTGFVIAPSALGKGVAKVAPKAVKQIGKTETIVDILKTDKLGTRATVQATGEFEVKSFFGKNVFITGVKGEVRAVELEKVKPEFFSVYGESLPKFKQIRDVEQPRIPYDEVKLLAEDIAKGVSKYEEVKPRVPSIYERPKSSSAFFSVEYDLSVAEPQKIIKGVSKEKIPKLYFSDVYDVAKVESRVSKGVEDIFAVGKSKKVEAFSTVELTPLKAISKEQKGTDLFRGREFRIETPVSGKAKEVSSVVREDLKIFEPRVSAESTFSESKILGASVPIDKEKTLVVSQKFQRFFSEKPNVRGSVDLLDVGIIREPKIESEFGKSYFSGRTPKFRRAIQGIRQELELYPEKRVLFTSFERPKLLKGPSRFEKFSDKELGTLLQDLKSPNYFNKRLQIQRQLYKYRDFIEPKSKSGDTFISVGKQVQIQRQLTKAKVQIQRQLTKAKSVSKGVQSSVVKSLEKSALRAGEKSSARTVYRSLIGANTLSRLFDKDKTKSTSRMRLSDKQTPIFKTGVKSLLKPLERTASVPKVGVSAKSILRPMEGVRAGEAQRVGVAMSIKAIDRVALRESEKRAVAYRISTPTVIAIKPPKGSNKLPGVRFGKEKQYAVKGKEEGYFAFVKEEPYKKAKYIKVNKQPLSEYQAKQLMFNVIDNTISQTGYLKKAGKPAAQSRETFFDISQKFNPTKNNTRYMEKRANAIDTIGEVNKLKASKYLKQRRKQFAFY